MKIAFLSYEYPPDTGYGGVATYTYQAAKMMSQRGHQVEVFAGSCDRTSTTLEAGIRVHRLQESKPKRFYQPIAQILAQRHNIVGFDVLEAPELDAEARYILDLISDLPLVIKLHSGNLLLWECNYYYSSGKPARLNRIEWTIEGKIRGFAPFWKRQVPPSGAILTGLKKVRELDRLEKSITLRADRITAPSQAIIEKMVKRWGLEPSRVAYLPNPYLPSARLLEIPVETKTDTITFIGRLEINKGVLDLAQAISLILPHFPRAKFRFVGATYQSLSLGDMRSYLEHFLLRRYRSHVEFTGAVPSSQIPDILADTDICVFPSLWDNFPCVCLEAMAAARGVVGTDSGGMAEMINSDRVGRLVPSCSPQHIAKAALELLKNPQKRMTIGRKARQRVLTEYNYQKISSLQEAIYDQAMVTKY